MKAIPYAILIVLLCFATQAGAVERTPFTQTVEEQHELLAGEDFSFKEVLKTGKEARGKGLVSFHGVWQDGNTTGAKLEVRSFLDGRMTLLLQTGDIFVAGNRYFKVLTLEKAKSGPFKGSRTLKIAIYTLAQ